MRAIVCSSWLVLAALVSGSVHRRDNHDAGRPEVTPPPLLPVELGDRLKLWNCSDADPRQQWFLNEADGTLALAANTSYCAGADPKAPKVIAPYVLLIPCTFALLTQQVWVWSEDTQTLRFQTATSDTCMGYHRDVATSAVLQQSCSGNPSTTKWAKTADGSSGGIHLASAGGGWCADVASNYGPPCANRVNAGAQFCNTSQPLATRVNDFVSKIPTTAYPGLFDNTASAIEATAFPAYQWWNEGLHGVADSPGVHYGGDVPATTSFPQVCSLGATFNRTLFGLVGDTIGREGRAMNNVGRAGLTYWAPNINIYRDPRWGRGQETPGEDPLLTATYAKEYVGRMQYNDLDPSRLRVASCCKHYAGYDLENWGGFRRHSFNAIIDDADLEDTFLPAFKACIHAEGGGSAGIMCSYNAVNGIPSCANGEMIQGRARGKWGFDGYVTSDCGAVSDVLDGNPTIGWPGHHYTNNTVDTVAVTLNAGMDSDCAIFEPSFIHRHLDAAMAAGKVTEATVTARLTDQFRLFMRLGFFDPIDSQPFKTYTAADINTPAAQKLALDAAREAITMLKFNKSLVPLDASKIGTLAVLGPNTNATKTLQGNYRGTAPYLISPFEAFVDALDAAGAGGRVVSLEGACPMTDFNATQFEAACDVVRGADATVLVMGNDNSIEDEGRDRDYLSLYGVQGNFIQRMGACRRTPDSPLVVVVLSGGSVDYSLILEDSNVAGTVWGGYPGQSGGTALADVIFGRVSPSGRLPHTVYPASYARDIDMANMRMPADASANYPGRTYRYYTGDAVLPFGHGLTYTEWRGTDAYGGSTLTVNGTAIDDAVAQEKLLLTMDVATVKIDLSNVGSRDSQFSVLVFVQPVPAGQLVGGALAGFTKVEVSAGGTATVSVSLSAQAFAQYDSSDKSQRVQKGEWRWFTNDPSLEGSIRVV